MLRICCELYKHPESDPERTNHLYYTCPRVAVEQNMVVDLREITLALFVQVHLQQQYRNALLSLALPPLSLSCLCFWTRNCLNMSKVERASLSAPLKV